MGSIRLTLHPASLAAAIGQPVDALDPDKLAFDAPFNIRRRGIEIKIIAGACLPQPDLTLLRTLAKAHRWAEALSRGTMITEIAARDGHSESYIRTRATQAVLSPKIQLAILAGTQPPDLTTQQILRADLPLDWDAQEQLPGFSKKTA
jgi:site-specific DNA recombinase